MNWLFSPKKIHWEDCDLYEEYKQRTELLNSVAYLIESLMEKRDEPLTKFEREKLNQFSLEFRSCP